jgi:hypothetical protein
MERTKKNLGLISLIENSYKKLGNQVSGINPSANIQFTWALCSFAKYAGQQKFHQEKHLGIKCLQESFSQ